MLLISGATGTIGGEIVRLLVSAGIPVRALVRDIQKAGSLPASGVELVQGTFEQAESLNMALQGVETAFLLFPSQPDQVRMQCAFVDAAKRMGVRRVVKLSGAGASENNPQQFARWHWQVEQYIRNSGMAFSFVQPVYFMQNFLGQDTTRMIAQQSCFAAPIAADLRYNVVDARDIAAVAAKVLAEQGYDGQTCVVTGPELLSSRQQAEILSEILGRHIAYVELQPAVFKNILLEAGQPLWLADGVLELFANLDTYVTDTVTTIAHKAPRTFYQFVQDHRQAFE